MSVTRFLAAAGALISFVATAAPPLSIAGVEFVPSMSPASPTAALKVNREPLTIGEPDRIISLGPVRESERAAAEAPLDGRQHVQPSQEVSVTITTLFWEPSRRLI